MRSTYHASNEGAATANQCATSAGSHSGSWTSNPRGAEKARVWERGSDDTPNCNDGGPDKMNPIGCSPKGF